MTTLDTLRTPCECLRCGYVWTSRRGRPRRCARQNCKSPYWDRPQKPGATPLPPTKEGRG